MTLPPKSCSVPRGTQCWPYLEWSSVHRKGCTLTHFKNPFLYTNDKRSNTLFCTWLFLVCFFFLQQCILQINPELFYSFFFLYSFYVQMYHMYLTSLCWWLLFSNFGFIRQLQWIACILFDLPCIMRGYLSEKFLQVEFLGQTVYCNIL